MFAIEGDAEMIHVVWFKTPARLKFVAVAASLFMALPARAHHSFAMFDMAKSVTLRGNVKELQWTNPHCYVQLLVPDGDKVAEWSVEMFAPVVMYRVGWRPGTMMPGDMVTIVVHPAKDNRNAGFLVSAVDAHGKSLRSMQLPGPPPPRSQQPVPSQKP